MIDGLLENRQGGGLPVEVVGGDPKFVTAGGTENQLQRLRMDFDLLELALLFGRASIGGIPIAIIFQLASGCSGNTPMGNFVQGAAVIVPGIENTGRFLGCWGHIKWLGGTTYQDGLMSLAKAVVEQLFKM